MKAPAPIDRDLTVFGFDLFAQCYRVHWQIITHAGSSARLAVSHFAK
jgi:hypothetical protein